MDSDKHQKPFKSGDYIFKEGEPSDYAYIIDSGKVEIFIENNGKKIRITTLKEGEIFGELALIDRLPRSGSARAILPTVVTKIPLDYINQNIKQSDPTIRLFLRLVMSRYRDLNTRLRQVLGILSPTQSELDSDYSSKTMEIKSLTSHLLDMKGRLDSVITEPAKEELDAPYSEQTMEISKVLFTEELMLRDAIRNKEFSLHYQPIIDLSNNQIAGCEALVRWNHPSGELVLPSRFLSQIEKNELIIELGYWIAEEACKFQNKVFNQLNREFFVSINLSGKQFNDTMLIPSLDSIMDKTGASREHIKFEITESLLIDNPELAAKSLNELKEIGAKLAIDDFGTGYSSFSYLHRFPFDILKIDRQFITSMPDNAKSEQIVKSLINLSHDLGMEVVAEGIETKQEAEMLDQYKPKFGQGFYFSKAVKESDFIALLQKPLTDTV